MKERLHVGINAILGVIRFYTIPVFVTGLMTNTQMSQNIQW